MNNFLVVSCYNNDISWIRDYPNDYIIYDRGTIPVVGDYKVIRSTNVGYNVWDMFRYIIDHYEELPEVITFAKGNIFPRHMRRAEFERLMNNQTFTPLFDKSLHTPHMPICMFSNDCWGEINNGDILVDERRHPTVFFKIYNDLLKWLYKDPIIPGYITFAPGANYVVPRSMILRYSVNFYQNLKKIVQHHQLPGEAHLIERLLYTMFTCTFETTEQANTFTE